MVIGTVYELRHPAAKPKAKATGEENGAKVSGSNGNNGYVYTVSSSSNNNNNNNGNNGQANGHTNKGFHPDVPLELHQMQAVETTGNAMAPAVPVPVVAKRQEMGLFTRMVLSFGLISNARAILTAKKLPDVSFYWVSSVEKVEAIYFFVSCLGLHNSRFYSIQFFPA